MANRQTYVVGALGVLLGMVIGANSAQRAEIVSFAGHNPNDAEIQEMYQLRRAAGIWRQRSDESGAYRVTEPRRSSIQDNVQDRLDQRLGDTTVFSSAPTETVRGGPAQIRQVIPSCSQYTRQRYVQCLEAILNGDTYQPNYYNTNY
ncbi:hypothetical protein COU75_00760 [Candidatus Peregrinibacteria bacterium CG10_big_fil_rev_8_21_14_0_10_42_8]|nr:MAG: hypothetical protein COU75_00760 [Candidatus Peregrinibacteria bacterium CG10_big_fil_rev_8_21_14_0_10_42_8]